jgi:hypothetical protein
MRVIGAAMAEAGVIGIGRLTLSRRERPVMVEPRSTDMGLFTLRAADEVRASQFARPESDFDAEMVAIAGAIIKQRIGNFDPSTYHDRYQDALRELIEAKMKGLPIKPKEVAAPAPVIDLMAALKRSLSQDAPPPKRQGRTRSAPAGFAVGRFPGVENGKARRRPNPQPRLQSVGEEHERACLFVFQSAPGDHLLRVRTCAMISAITCRIAPIWRRSARSAPRSYSREPPLIWSRETIFGQPRPLPFFGGGRTASSWYNCAGDSRQPGLRERQSSIFGQKGDGSRRGAA